MANYFERNEFRCPCCKRVQASGWLVHLLNKARESYGKPIFINSGYRCEKHNKAVGSKSTSAHRKGLAVDLKCDNSTDRYLLIYILLQVGFKRIGIGDTFIHVDIDESLPQEVMWGY